VDTIRLAVGQLIDGNGSPASANQALLIEDGTIVTVGPDASVPRPAHARTYASPAATAVPGLIDTHIHLVIPRTPGSMLDEMLAMSDDELVVLGAASSHAVPAPVYAPPTYPAKNVRRTD